MYARSQWETTSHCNVVSHWLAAFTNDPCDLWSHRVFETFPRFSCRNCLALMSIGCFYGTLETDPVQSICFYWQSMAVFLYHNDVIKWKHFPRYWPFVRGIHRSPVNSPQWRGALMFSLICVWSVWINGWVNNREAGDLRRYCAHYDVIVIPHKQHIRYCRSRNAPTVYDIQFALGSVPCIAMVIKLICIGNWILHVNS